MLKSTGYRLPGQAPARPSSLGWKLLAVAALACLIVFRYGDHLVVVLEWAGLRAEPTLPAELDLKTPEGQRTLERGLRQLERPGAPKAP